MRSLLLVLSIFFAAITIGNSQSTILKILGKHSYTPEKEGTLIEVEFVENINVCDPVHGYKTLEDMEYAFEQTLKKKGISFKKFVKEDNLIKTHSKLAKGTRKSIFQYICSNPSEVKDIYTSATLNFAENIKVNEKYPKHQFEKEDQPAIKAVRDAKERAKYIAEGLNMKINSILSIDDITNLGYSSFLAEMMMDRDFGSLVGSRSYGIWVTFELRPI